MQPDIFLGALRISEPVIALTGLGIAAVCSYAWWRLRQRNTAEPAQQWMMYFFGLMAISSLIGPFFGHAFNYWAGFPGKFTCWMFSMFSLSALAQGSILHAQPYLKPGMGRWLTGINWSVLVLALVIAALKKTFHWVEVHSAVALLGLMAPLESRVYRLRRDPGSRLLLWSLPLAILAVIPHVVKWSPSIWFTYFDVGHVLLYPCFGLMLLGAERLEFDLQPVKCEV